jgi:hypothetical protein
MEMGRGKKKTLITQVPVILSIMAPPRTSQQALGPPGTQFANHPSDVKSSGPEVRVLALLAV